LHVAHLYQPRRNHSNRGVPVYLRYSTTRPGKSLRLVARVLLKVNSSLSCVPTFRKFAESWGLAAAIRPPRNFVKRGRVQRALSVSATSRQSTLTSSHYASSPICSIQVCARTRRTRIHRSLLMYPRSWHIPPKPVPASEVYDRVSSGSIFSKTFAACHKRGGLVLLSEVVAPREF
jgi:hypothetical protein